MSWKQAAGAKQEIVLVTASRKGKPHAIVVISEGFVDDKLLVAACMMKTTLKNLKENNQVCVVAKRNKEYYRIRGRARLYSSGKYFNYLVNEVKEYKVHHAIVISITEVFDLDNVKKIL